MVSPSRLPTIPFPTSGVPTHPLLIVDYAKLLLSDPSEIQVLWKSCTELGFFYLKNSGIDYQEFYRVGQEVFALGEEEKAKYDVGLTNTSFGYKAIGNDICDDKGTLDTNEQFNISRDDMLSYPEVTHCSNPKPIIDNIEACQKFTSDARTVALTLITLLEPSLSLPPGTLAALHKEGPGFQSASKGRVIRSPPQGEGGRLNLGAHTDFGTISLVDNNMTGGLQVLAPGTEDWQFVKPIEGCLVVNIADALAIFSGGILRSNLHRVIPPPLEQRQCLRWSSIFFLVPEYTTLLTPLSHLSPTIAAAASETSFVAPEGVTTREWFMRRINGVRAKTGSWAGSRGTEYIKGL